MAELTIAQLTELLAAGVDNADLLPIWDTTAAETKKITISNFRTAVGVTNWAESFSSATQATSRWIPSNAAANVNAAIVPKGTGALIASIPDGAITGGNARGVNAVDFQRVRGLGANRVATGERSFIGNGENNSVSGRNSAVLSGDNNGVSGNNSAVVTGITNTIAGADCRSFIGGGNQNSITSFPTSVGIVSGQSNTANANYAFIGGGQTNTASGQWSSVIGGQTNTASGSHSTVSGGQGNSAGSTHDFIGGGSSNGTGGTDNAFWKFIGGGSNNSVSGSQTSYGGIACGNANVINSGRFTFIGGGRSNTITSGGWDSTIGGGQSNYVDGDNQNATHQSILGGFDNRTKGPVSAIIGGQQAATTLTGQIAHASGQFSVRGDAQAHELVWRRLVAGAPVGGSELFLNGSSAAAILPATNSVWHGIIDCVAICTATGDGTTVVGAVEATSYKVTIKRIGTATSLVGTVQEIGTTNADASMATGVFTIDNNDTNESLRIVFTSPATAGSTTNIRCVATFRGTQIQY